MLFCLCMTMLSPRGILTASVCPCHVSSPRPGLKVAFCRPERLFILTPSLLDRTDGVERGEAMACFFCSKVTAGVTFPSQALSAKSRYLQAR